MPAIPTAGTVMVARNINMPVALLSEKKILE